MSDQTMPLELEVSLESLDSVYLSYALFNTVIETYKADDVLNFPKFSAYRFGKYILMKYPDDYIGVFKSQDAIDAKEWIEEMKSNNKNLITKE